jgi:CRP-like cAMP-binding protein
VTTLRRVRGQDRPKRPKNVHAFPARTDGGPQNRLLGLLPPAALARLEPHLHPVNLYQKEVLFRAHEPLKVADFPTTALVSLVSTLESGEALEVGLIGCDGLAGTAVFPGVTMMPCDGIVQIPGMAERISMEILRREVLADETLYSTLGRFAQLMLVRSMQLSMCNMFHSVEQRCARWLLTVSDLIDTSEIHLTHDLMATTLGVHRPTVTVVLRSLHIAGLVNEARGLIEIRDRRGLERACCECYRAMRNEQQRLLGY